MVQIFRMLLSKQNMPRWLIFLVDMLIVSGALFLAYMVRFNFHVPPDEIRQWPQVFAIVLGVRAISFIVSKTYAGMIRYTSTEDAIRIFTVVLVGSILFVILNVISYYLINSRFAIPFSIIVIEFMTVVLLMITFRIVVKIAYLEILNPGGAKTRVIIFGAGEAGVITKRALDRDLGIRYKVIAFIDDDKSKWGKKLEGVPISDFDKLQSLLANNDIDNLIISAQKISSDKKQEIVDVCLPFGTKVMSVPPVANWINGELSFKQIKNIKIEDLLERDEIKLDANDIQKELEDKIVLVTGASGSIGSELVRQILLYNPKEVVLIDQAESAMFDLEVELNDRYHDRTFKIAVADICNEIRMDHAFWYFKPDIVYHAAAYKHVPMMENNPSEALNTNIKGTKLLLIFR